MQIGRKLIHLESVDSTNNYTANLLKIEGLTSGTVILADEQFAGRGQRGAEWHVEPGLNLTFSVYLELVNLSVVNQFDLSKIVALSIVDFLSKDGIVSTIKWPNDILVKGKKISGVLIENSVSSSRPLRSIVGIGININQMEFGELNATSIRQETGQFYPIRDALFSFIEAFNQLLEALLSKPDELNERYLANLFQMNQRAWYLDAREKFEGEICGVEATGKLIILRNGEKMSYDLKEIHFL